MRIQSPFSFAATRHNLFVKALCEIILVLAEATLAVIFLYPKNTLAVMRWLIDIHVESEIDCLGKGPKADLYQIKVSTLMITKKSAIHTWSLTVWKASSSVINPL